MASRESHCVIEEEEWGPVTGFVQWRSPPSIGGETCDPELPAMVTNELALIVDETAAIPCEHASSRYGIQVSERIDPVATGHVRARADCSRESR